MRIMGLESPSYMRALDFERCDFAQPQQATIQIATIEIRKIMGAV
jgi:hypothetical protein